MKKRQLLALWLLCGIILPLSTQAYEDWIYTWVDEYWNEVKTIIFWWNDTFSGVQLTIKMTDQTWKYYWWFNENTDNSVWDDDSNPWTWTYMSWDGKMHGGTFWEIRNNIWWWGADTYENWFNPNPSEESKIAKRWPCDSGYHVPSRWEWNALAIAWCNLDNECNGRYSDYTSWWVVWDFQKASNWTSGNNLIYISKYWIKAKFKDEFKISGFNFWSSSSDNLLYAFSLNAIFEYPYYYFFRNEKNNPVRCLRNSIVEPLQTFILSFMGSEWGSVSTWSIEVEEWSSISRDDEAGTVSISWTVVATGIADEWYAFSWWLTDCDGDTVTTGCSFTGVFKLETYTITYELNWWINSENNLTWYTIKDTITFENPTKEWFSFDGWFTDAQFTTWITSISTLTTWPITVYAKWTENKKSSWSSGWGGRSNKTSDDEKDTTNNPSVTDVTAPLESGAQWDSNDGSPLSRGDTASAERGSTQNYTQEFQDAYTFAHEKWITTMPTIQEAQMDWKLTRIAMAKMLSQYAMNVLWQKPANIVTPKFNDVTDKQNSDYDDWVILAYQLWIMWQNMPNNKFRPNDEVTRAEFATALSRMLYHTSDWQYKSTDKYYTNHMKKLVQEKIITNDDPKMKELRWYVMIMLMRSAK